MLSKDHPSARFGSSLAKVLYTDPDIPGAVRPSIEERELLRVVKQRIREASEQELHGMCFLIDTEVIPKLSGECLNELGEAIELRAAWMVAQIPRLAEHKQRLRRASEFSQVFSQDNLAKLCQAFKDEAQLS